MKNKAVVLVYPSSRTRNLIKNIRELNYTPIVISATAHDKLTLQTRGTTVINQWASAVKSKEYAKYKPDILEFDKNMDYQKLTNYIKNKYDVLAVIPCSDLSIKLGDFLQKEFKLTSNPKE
ncbi:hypothetical protein FACS189459_6720 [Bacilli bacterium]|nr:hypothetical protein FACS189459_6720 [Bacilli bacterium]